MYTPPFKITSKILNLVAEISGKIERYAILMEQDTELRLRKANRIRGKRERTLMQIHLNWKGSSA